MTEVAETNGHTNGNGSAAKPDSALVKLLASIKGKSVNEADKKKASEAFKKAMGKRQELQKALDDFDAQTDALAVNMVKCFGTKHVSVDGVRYVPTSRGTRVYYKRMTDKPADMIEL